MLSKLSYMGKSWNNTRSRVRTHVLKHTYLLCQRKRAHSPKRSDTYVDPEMLRDASRRTLCCKEAALQIASQSTYSCSHPGVIKRF